jgi:Probable cobalt transporter subunit (CbtA)
MAAPDGRRLIEALVIAGVVAALLAGAFHLAVSERFVDRAIALEEAARERELAGAAGAGDEPVFSRRTQKFGLVIGGLLYGLAAGMVFAGAYALLARRLPGRSRRAQIAVLAGAVVVAVVLVPFLKYPSNPPGVGDPETLTRRQLLFVGCVLLSVAGAWLAARGTAALRSRGWSAPAAVAAGIVFYMVWAGVLVLALPDRGDPVSTPTRLLWQFRAASLGGQLIYWLVFAAVFAIVLDRGKAETPVAART